MNKIHSGNWLQIAAILLSLTACALQEPTIEKAGVTGGVTTSGTDMVPIIIAGVVTGGILLFLKK